MEQESFIDFLEPGELVDGDLDLVLIECSPGNPKRGRVPSYKFEMRHRATQEVMGHIDLRIGNTDDIVMYAGHIGYAVEPWHRGHHYAARSCRLLLPLAREHNLGPLWITCNPDNVPSRRTIEGIGGKLVEIVPLPEEHEMYKKGERYKCRYRIDL